MRTSGKDFAEQLLEFLLVNPQHRGQAEYPVSTLSPRKNLKVIVFLVVHADGCHAMCLSTNYCHEVTSVSPDTGFLSSSLSELQIMLRIITLHDRFAQVHAVPFSSDFSVFKGSFPMVNRAIPMCANGFPEIC